MRGGPGHDISEFSFRGIALVSNARISRIWSILVVISSAADRLSPRERIFFPMNMASVQEGSESRFLMWNVMVSVEGDENSRDGSCISYPLRHNSCHIHRTSGESPIIVSLFVRRSARINYIITEETSLMIRVRGLSRSIHREINSSSERKIGTVGPINVGQP